jgi:hypothetical protein
MVSKGYDVCCAARAFRACHVNVLGSPYRGLTFSFDLAGDIANAYHFAHWDLSIYVFSGFSYDHGRVGA